MFAKRLLPFITSSSHTLSILRAAPFSSLIGRVPTRLFGVASSSNFEVIELESADDFEKFAQSEKPIIVDFYGQ